MTIEVNQHCCRGEQGELCDCEYVKEDLIDAHKNDTPSRVSKARHQNELKDHEIRIDFSHLDYQINISAVAFDQRLQNRRSIIKDLSGSFGTGLNAILGASGAGKTTFLKLLAKKIEQSKTNTISGSVTANGHDFTASSFKKFAGFVMQDDYLLATMTVRECVQFAADMKLTSLSEVAKQMQVESILRILMLSSCQNTLIGDTLNKGVSGGERKRCSIGVELIGNPQVLFLDEPTSGLDSFTAFKIISALQNYSRENNRTIIFTIHQPSSDLWNVLNHVTFLCDGNIVYSGLRSHILSYFSSHGYSCPILSNPADYFINLLHNLDVKSIQILQSEYMSIAKRRPPLPETAVQTNMLIGQESIESKQQHFWYFVSRLMKRQFLNIKRNKILLRARLIQSLCTNTLTGLIYWNISTDDTSNNENAFHIVKTIFFITMGIVFQGMNPQVITFSVERAVVLKEQDSGMYGSAAYFLSKILPEIVIGCYFGFQVTTIMYFMIGFYATAAQYFFFVLILMLMANIGNAIGIIASASFHDPKLATVSVSFFMIPILVFGGIFKNLNDMYTSIAWIRFLSPTYYSVCALAESQLDGSGFTLDYVNYLRLDFGKWGGVYMLIAYYICANIIAYILLLLKRSKLQ